MLIREFRPTDLEAVAALFTASVHGLTGDHYDEDQRRAWAPVSPDVERWRRKTQVQQFLLAEQDGELRGMVGYEPNGHVDVLFTSPAHARKGIAKALHGAARQALAESGVVELFTEASEVARPFFANQGYEVVGREVVEVRGFELVRYRMRLRASPIAN